MKPLIWIVSFWTCMVIPFSLSSADGDVAQPALPKSLHDGVVTVMKEHCFETVFSSDGIQIYMYDIKMAPMLMQRVKATATILTKGGSKIEAPLVLDSPKSGEKTIYFCPMHAEIVQAAPGICEPCGGMELIPHDRLFGKANLSKAAPAPSPHPSRSRG